MYSALVWIKMMKAKSLRIAVLDFCIDHTLPNGLPGNFFIISSLFFFLFAGHAYGLMIINRENSMIIRI